MFIGAASIHPGDLTEVTRANGVITLAPVHIEKPKTSEKVISYLGSLKGVDIEQATEANKRSPLECDSWHR
jgi:hypothetical protein